MNITEKVKKLVQPKEDEQNTMIMRSVKYKAVKKWLGTNFECTDNLFD